MRNEENCIILEEGDRLFRYDLVDNLPINWSTEYHNPQYEFPGRGYKNQIGAFSFFDNYDVVDENFQIATKKMRDRMPQMAIHRTITSCHVIDEIKLLNLYTGLFCASAVLKTLIDSGINVLGGNFINNATGMNYSILSDDMILLGSDQLNMRMEAANRINQFFGGTIEESLRHLGQSLTDFENGIAFRNMLLEQEYEGYVFQETANARTICLLDSRKISEPIHEA